MIVAGLATLFVTATGIGLPLILPVLIALVETPWVTAIISSVYAIVTTATLAGASDCLTGHDEVLSDKMHQLFNQAARAVPEKDSAPPSTSAITTLTA